MKNLIIIRHAKSSWNDPVSDKLRKLSERGRNDATIVSAESSKWMIDDFFLFSSSAIRAIETASIFATNYSFPLNQIIINDDLYTFDENKLEIFIRTLNKDLENVILFGHNSAITNFVNKFGDIFIENVPTSGLVWIKFDCKDWKLLKKGSTIKVLFPRDLKYE
jgi:phosphohistidine phosphatase